MDGPRTPLIRLLNEELTQCRMCDRLVGWRERVGREKRRSFADETYWAKPVPYFGDPEATHLILGLAPAAHGANRTGRMFTGDRSGDFLFASLHRAGVANQPHCVSADDGLMLTSILIAATCHCAPPDNKPTPDEIQNCSGYLKRLLATGGFRSVLCLGGIAWGQFHRILGTKAPLFGHGARSELPDGLVAIGSYHPSQQNTFTGRLTPAMLDQVIQAWLSV